ncbi:MAG: VWA domain-containing protein [Spirochaetales bacterium]|nr:VWA domain-containing protein [Spirochaetales bacterium]
MYGRFGRYIRARIPRGRVGELSIDATLRAAALRKISLGYRGIRVQIQREDLREKVRAIWGNRLVLFLVDASDSMDVSHQLASAKGAVLLLLSAAYVRRDRVGMIVFRDEKARVLVPPTTSVDLAREKLFYLTPGGATPLADGLYTAWQLVRSERLKYPGRAVVLIILSDGEGNVPLVPGGDRGKEVEILAELIRKERIHVVFVDTTPEGKSSAAPRELSTILGGEYKRLQRVHTSDLVDIAVQEYLQP